MPNPSSLLIVALIGLGLAGFAAFLLQFTRRPSRRAMPTMIVGLAIGFSSLSAFAMTYAIDDGVEKTALRNEVCLTPLHIVCRPARR